jgi:hypothetical protein
MLGKVFTKENFDKKDWKVFEKKIVEFGEC